MNDSKMMMMNDIEGVYDDKTTFRDDYNDIIFHCYF